MTQKLYKTMSTQMDRKTAKPAVLVIIINNCRQVLDWINYNRCRHGNYSTIKEKKSVKP